jgi:hypothetical protein
MRIRNYKDKLSLLEIWKHWKSLSIKWLRFSSLIYILLERKKQVSNLESPTHITGKKTICYL